MEEFAFWFAFASILSAALLCVLGCGGLIGYAAAAWYWRAGGEVQVGKFV